MEKKIKIAIDGPAASGKSTTARLLAKKLGYLYIDTGAMYRAATLAVIKENIDVNDEDAVYRCIKNTDIELRNNRKGRRTWLNGTDVTGLIRAPEVEKVISKISAYAEVRRILVEKQRRMAAGGGVVMDGRDIGTVVLKDAELKVFIIASIKERAKRRMGEMERKGLRMTPAEIEKEIERRDRLDSTRAHAPLKKAPDARELDTSNLTVEQQVDIVYNWAKEIISQ